MKAEDWFALAVRVVGVAILLPGLGLLLDHLLQRLGYFTVADTHPLYYLVFGFAEVIAGLYLIRGAPFLVRFAYPTDLENNVSSEEKPAIE